MKRIHTAQWLLRRIAGRCIRVHARQKGKSAGLAVYDDSLPVLAGSYNERFDALRQLAKRRMKERREGKESILDVIHALRIWAPIVARDIEEVRAGEFGESVSVPDDVIRDGWELIKYSTEHTDKDGEPLPYAEALKDDLTPVLEAAEKEWGEAEDAQESYASLRTQLIEVGVELQKDLVAYRKTLKAVIGRGHPDYQKLRIDRARTPDEDDDEVAAALPEGLPEEPQATTPTPAPQPGEEAQPSS